MSSAMMILPIVMLGGMALLCSIVVAFVVFYNNNNNLFALPTDPPTESTSSGKNCVVVARDECSGKTGDDRASCISKSKKTCMETSGNYWDPDKATEQTNEENKYIKADWLDSDILVPAEARKHTDENCVYFYDYHPPWTDSNGGIRKWGQWCIHDGVDRDVPIWDVKNNTGGLGHKDVDYIRVGKNIDLTVWDNHIKTPDFKGSGESKMYLGSDFGNKRLIDSGHNGVGSNDIDAFRIAKAS